MITVLSSIDWLSTTGISSPLASITTNGWKNCAFIWITERRNVTLHHPLVDRLARPKGLRSQDRRVRPRLNTSKRSKVNEVKASSITQILRPPPTTELQKRGKDCLSHKDHVRRQRAEREASKMTSAAAPREATLNELLVKRAAILDDRADTKLNLKDKAVFQYCEERRMQYYQHGGGMDEDEVVFNQQYDSEQFFLVQKLLEKGDNNNNDNEGHGSAEQGHR